MTRILSSILYQDTDIQKSETERDTLTGAMNGFVFDPLHSHGADLYELLVVEFGLDCPLEHNNGKW
jgi:hypothetical protein